jgi:hypothetical protein
MLIQKRHLVTLVKMYILPSHIVTYVMRLLKTNVSKNRLHVGFQNIHDTCQILLDFFKKYKNSIFTVNNAFKVWEFLACNALTLLMWYCGKMNFNM